MRFCVVWIPGFSLSHSEEHLNLGAFCNPQGKQFIFSPFETERDIVYQGNPCYITLKILGNVYGYSKQTMAHSKEEKQRTILNFAQPGSCVRGTKLVAGLKYPFICMAQTLKSFKKI